MYIWYLLCTVSIMWSSIDWQQLLSGHLEHSNLFIFGLARQLTHYNWWTTCNITASMQIYFITSRQLLYTIGLNPNIYRQIPWIYHGNYSGGNYLLTFLVITFLFLIFRSWKFAWLDLLGAYFEKWSRFVRTTTLPWVSTTWSTSLKRWWTSSWCSNSTSGHATDLILVSNPWFLGARNHFGPFPEALDWIEGQ